MHNVCNGVLTFSARDDLVKYMNFGKDGVYYRYSSSVFYHYPDTPDGQIEISRERANSRYVRTDVSKACFRLRQDTATGEGILEVTSEFDC